MAIIKYVVTVIVDLEISHPPMLASRLVSAISGDVLNLPEDTGKYICFRGWRN